MAEKTLELAIRELQQTVNVKSNKLTGLDCKITEQSEFIKKQSDLMKVLIPNSDGDFAIRELQQTVNVMSHILTELECKITEQSELIKKQSDLMKVLILNSGGDTTAQALQRPTRKEKRSAKMSILDLNEDCWRLLLSYVPVKDIILSERTSRRWQKNVLEYLSSIRIAIEEHISYALPQIRDVRWVQTKIEKVVCPSFELWCDKLGPAVTVASCASEQRLKTIPEQCPNLRTVKFISLSEDLLQKHSDVFKKLEYLCFFNCDVSDGCIAKFISNNKLRKLLISYNTQLKGHCLLNINKTLQSLALRHCETLEYPHLSSAVKQLKGLEELDLQFVPEEIYIKMHLLLPHTSNLRVLIVCDYDFEYDNFFDAICELRELEFLYTGFQVYDEDLVALMRRCEKLRVLLLYACHGVTGSGLRAACALAGQRLKALSISYNSDHLTNDDVVACIRACPNLESLDVSGCQLVTRDLLPLAAAARREVRPRTPLHFYAADIPNDLRSNLQEEFEGLIRRTGYLSDAMQLR